MMAAASQVRCSDSFAQFKCSMNAFQQFSNVVNVARVNYLRTRVSKISLMRDCGTNIFRSRELRNALTPMGVRRCSENISLR